MRAAARPEPGYAYMHTPMYSACVRDFAHDQRALADLQVALAELADNPFGSPRLQTHAMRGRPGRKTFISSVGNRGHRLIWQRVNRTIVLLLFGEHDPVEERAARLDYEVNDDTGAVRIVEYERRVARPEAPPAARGADEPGSLFMAWTDGELAGFGFAAHEIPVLRRLDTEDDLLALADRMRQDSLDRALNLWLHKRPEPPEEERELERKVAAPASRETFAPVEPDVLAEVLSKPIEDWMVFLHPEQAKLTQRPFSGPARVRGGAGTGKTVVALHRARHLADTYARRVLFTTYVTNLPRVFQQLYTRLDPDGGDRVEFVNLHAWAYRFVRRHGRPFTLDGKLIDAAYAEAWRRAVPEGGVIQRNGLTRDYYRQEIDWVIKGRGLDGLQAYLALARTGRGTPLAEPHRREVWALYVEYARQLDRRGVIDFNDLVLRALELVCGGRLDEPYAAVVIDEAQDLTEVGLRLAYELAGRDKRDGLFMVGDGQQSVYPGGYNLASIGIDVRGRSALLRTNYRNTREILDAAQRIVRDRPFDDGDDEPAAPHRSLKCLRDGEPPVFCGFATADDHDTALVAAIDEAARAEDCSGGDLAVLVPTRRLTREYASLIDRLGLPVQPLDAYDGIPNEAIKVGTYQRGKGLEFKRVFLPRLEPETVGERRRLTEDDAEYRERTDLLRRQLFVAMTRARDRVWAGWVGHPAGLLGLDG